MVTTSYSWPNKVVLVVEDDLSSLMLLKAILSKTGVRVLVAEDGESAIDVIQSKLKVDMVLMDIKLKGLSGLEATKQIRKLQPNLPVIAQTACAISGDMERCFDAGCNAYLTKPISRDKLLETMDYYFRRKIAYELLEVINNN
ncbi:MAG: response regulator [Tenuifilaceae bacterium]|uniref:response regulator n=1 Tax=Perlabentimonas gracilis TaxID=2715279 RepID=UPI0014094FFA|nr:response regulator [Perlabentimonas gracilis]MDX9771121.1 response regulator [Tenuifilaceae bacterium]NHB70152.1 response regulator [Perlabentimonas gracilis]